MDTQLRLTRILLEAVVTVRCRGRIQGVTLSACKLNDDANVGVEDWIKPPAGRINETPSDPAA